MFSVPLVSVAESDAEGNALLLSSDGQYAAPESTAPAPAEEQAPDYTAKAKANGRSYIKVKWSKVDDADEYTVYRSEKKGKLGKKVFTTDKASQKSFTDKGADIDMSYWYTVKAWDNSGDKKKAVAVIKTDKVRNSLKYSSSFTAKTYAYSGGGTTASGKKAQVGRVAVDPNVIKLGTWLYIEDYGLCQAADTGGAIKGNKVDLYMNSESECYAWGIRQKDLYILE
jgi:3D (Asp-Asp-Asp) domain-containing protein